MTVVKDNVPPPLASFGACVWTSENQPGTTHRATLPHWVIGMTLEGRCQHGPPEGPRFVCEPGDFGFIHPAIPQAWTVIGKVNWRVVSAVIDPRPHWLEWLKSFPQVAPGFVRLPLMDSAIRQAITETFQQAEDEFRRGGAEATDLVHNSVERALLLARRQKLPEREGRFDPRVQKSLLYLNQNLNRNVSFGELADFCHVSRPHLASLFKKHLGEGAIEHHQRIRMQRALQLLRMSPLPVKRIALELGFEDPKYFSTCCRRFFGQSPRQLRGGS